MSTALYCGSGSVRDLPVVPILYSVQLPICTLLYWYLGRYSPADYISAISGIVLFMHPLLLFQPPVDNCFSQ